MINVSRPSIKPADLQAVERVFASGWLGLGEKVSEFEQQCKELLQCRHFIALSSCTKAIEVALIVSGCNRGDEVIVPSFTYASVIQVILKLGLVPVFADIDPHNLGISPPDVENKITHKTRIILPLHFRGHAYYVDAIKTIAETHGLNIIEDAAHAFGSYCNDKPVGADTYASCFSFGPLKNICCIEGGGIATSNDELAKKLSRYRSLGMDRSTWNRYNNSNETPWHYLVSGPGDKCEMNNVNAAVGISQLKRFNDIKTAKKNIVANYITELSGISGISVPETDTDKDLAYIFTVLVAPDLRERLMSYLWGKGIVTAIHYYPNHLQPYFRQYNTGTLPNTEAVGARILTLPSYTDLSEYDQLYVTDSIKSFMKTT